jgi:hypothetical protein
MSLPKGVERRSAALREALLAAVKGAPSCESVAGPRAECKRGAAPEQRMGARGKGDFVAEVRERE